MATSENTICHRFQIDKYWDTCTLFLLCVILEQNSVFVKRSNLIGMTYRIKNFLSMELQSSSSSSLSLSSSSSEREKE